MAEESIQASAFSCKPVTIYAFQDPRNGEIRYVGKTEQLMERIRMHRWLMRHDPGRAKYAWMRDLMSSGLKPAFVVLEIVPPGQDWAAAEKRQISELRAAGHHLLNICSGGQGGSVEALRKAWADPDIRQRRLTKIKTVTSSPEYRVKMRNILLDKWRDPEFRKMMIAARSDRFKHRGPLSDEAKSEASRKTRERWSDPEFRARYRTLHEAVVTSDEYRKKVSASIKRLWLDPRYRRKMIAAQVEGIRRRKGVGG